MAFLGPLPSNVSALGMLQQQIGMYYTPVKTFQYQITSTRLATFSNQSFYANTSECVCLVWQT